VVIKAPGMSSCHAARVRRYEARHWAPGSGYSSPRHMRLRKQCKVEAHKKELQFGRAILAALAATNTMDVQIPLLRVGEVGEA